MSTRFTEKAGQFVDQEKTKAIDWLISHPESIAKGLDFLLRLIKKEGTEYLDQYRKLKEAGAILVMVAPHWSVADMLLFYYVTQALNTEMIAPASAKFFDGRMGILGKFLDAFAELKIKFEKMVQSQDQDADQNTNSAIWLGVVKKLLSGEFMLGIFPQGTRSRKKQAEKANRVTTYVISKIFAMLSRRKNLVFMPMSLSGSDEFWPVGSDRPKLENCNQLKLTVGAPLDFAQAKSIASMCDCQIADAALIVALAQTPEECWGDYIDAINKYLNPPISRI